VIEGRAIQPEGPLPPTPPGPTLARTVVAATRSNTKTSQFEFVSPLTRSAAMLVNTT